MLPARRRGRAINRLFGSVIVGLFTAHALFGASTNVSCEYITIDDGLSDNYITKITHDSLGYLWLATMDGLNRYDGESFTIFQNIPGDSTSLSDNYIRDFDIDLNGNLYIATNNGGLNILDVSHETVKRCHLTAESGKEFRILNMVHCDVDGNVWIGTRDGTLLRYNTLMDSVDWLIPIPKDLSNKNSNIIQQVYPDGSDILWVTSGLGGLDKISYPDGQIEHVLKAGPIPSQPFRRNGCGGIVKDQRGRFWVSRVSGLDSYDPNNGKHQQFSFPDAKGEMLKSLNLIMYDEDQILLSSYYDLLQFDISNETYKIIDSVLPQYFTSALYHDSSGIIWAGTMGYGLIMINPQKKQFHTHKGNFLQALFSKELNLLADSSGVELNLRDRDFLSIIRDKQGNVWVATQYWGLYRVSHDGEIRKYTMGQPDKRQRYRVIYEIFEDSCGDIWVSTSGGVCKLDSEKSVFNYVRLYPNKGYSNYERDYFALNPTGYIDISCIHQDTANIFWFGTPELGLIRFNSTTDSISYHPVALSNSEKNHSVLVLSIAEDPQKSKEILWLGTEGGGLVRFNKVTGETQFITTRHGLPNNTVNCVLPGNGQNLWMSTNLGLSRYSTLTGQVVNFDIRDNLQSNGFNRREAYKTPEGELFFGGSNGYNHFFPDAIQDNQGRESIVLTGIDLLNEPLSYTENNLLINAPMTQLRNLALENWQAMMLTFHYTSLNYSASHRDHFAYRMEGFDKQWIHSGENKSAVYTNLNPGKYVFRVRYEDSIQQTSAPELSLNVTILPPFWQTWWFRSGMVVLLLLIIAYFLRFLFLKQEEKRLHQQYFSQQLLSSQERERQRISGELHDGIGQSLLIIKNMLQLGLNQFAQKENPSDQLESVSDLVSQIIQEVRDISHNLSPQHLAQLGLTSTLESVIENLERSTDLVFDVQIDDIDSLLPAEQEIHFYRIVQESLNNIIKHSKSTHVTISITNIDGHLKLLVQDDGVGISNILDSANKGIGLSGMAERARLLHGVLEINSGKPTGTMISLVINLSTDDRKKYE